MCGFVGFYSRKIENKEETVRNMGNMIIHRGPDSEGIYTDDEIAMGFRRLSIIDLAEGSQPMKNEDGSIIITFNGEIYNYQEIKKDLLEKGHIFRNNSDTEVLIHGYEEYGTDLLGKLRGMFAFVIWDSVKKQLFGARDFFGIKPFYYSKIGDELLFGSEIKSFLPFPGFKKEVNEEALKHFLVFQYSVLNETFFKNVNKLKPGHYFIFRDGKMEISKYFDLSYKVEDKPFEEYVKLIGESVEESVKYHKISDVEVGAFLSGGVDSSYVVSCAKPDNTYSVGFDNQGFDETVYAKELSEKLNIQNKSKMISADEFFAAIPMVQYHSDEPHANLSSVPLYYLSQLAAKDVKVVLSGEGADELFAGYNEYEEPTVNRLYSMLPMGLRRKIRDMVKDRPHFTGKTIIMKYGQSVEERYIGQAHIMSDEQANDILSSKYKNPVTYREITKPYYDKVKNLDDVTKRCYLDMNMWIVDDILLKADKITMAHSIELRVPFLDKEVWNLSTKISVKYKVNGTTTKYVFREAAQKKIPLDWAKRRKAGFLVPFIHWIKEEKYCNIVRAQFEKEYVSEFFDREKILALLDEHYAGKKNNGRKIYTIYAFLVWYDQYFVSFNMPQGA